MLGERYGRNNKNDDDNDDDDGAREIYVEGCVARDEDASHCAELSGAAAPSKMPAKKQSEDPKGILRLDDLRGEAYIFTILEDVDRRRQWTGMDEAAAATKTKGKPFIQRGRSVGRFAGWMDGPCALVRSKVRYISIIRESSSRDGRTEKEGCVDARDISGKNMKRTPFCFLPCSEGNALCGGNGL